MTERLELRLPKQQMSELQGEAQARGISVQDLLRVVILADWFANKKPTKFWRKES